MKQVKGTQESGRYKVWINYHAPFKLVTLSCFPLISKMLIFHGDFPSLGIAFRDQSAYIRVLFRVANIYPLRGEKNSHRKFNHVEKEKRKIILASNIQI